MIKTEELAQAISDCVDVDITANQRLIDSSAVPHMINQLNQNGWLDPTIKATLLKEFNLDDPYTWPDCYESYDFAGNTHFISQVYITNKGAGQFVDRKWVTVDYDSSDTNRPMFGVTYYLNHSGVMTDDSI